MNAVCCFQPSCHGEQWMVYTSCVTSQGNHLENVFFLWNPKGVCQGALCVVHRHHECDVKFSFLYIYTCFTHKYLIEVWDNLCVYSIHVCLGFRRRKTELTRHKSERHHLPVEGYISGMDIKMSKSIQGRLIMVGLKGPISFHRQGDRRVRLGHRT